MKRTARINAALAITLVCSGAASADVFTEATAGINFANSSYTYGYNAPTGPISSSTGTGTYGGCYPNVTCSISALGTVDSTGKLQGSYDSVTMNASVPPDNVGHAGYSGSASAYAVANAATGSIGVSGTGTYNIVPAGYQEGGTGQAQAGVSDTLHFTIAGANGSTVTLLPVTYTVTGSLTAGGGYSSMDAQFNLGSGHLDEQASVGASGPPSLTQQNVSGWQSYTITQTGPASFTFNGVYAITGASADLGVYEYMSAYGGGGNSSDFSHTGVVGINLGTGVSFTSDSGVFLTQGAAATPEPGTLALVVGVGVLLCATRKKRANM